jgi:protein-disulfide isomerase
MARFEAELADHIHAARVREDFDTGVASGVNATPTLFVNGVRADDEHYLRSVLGALERARLGVTHPASP